MLTARPVMFVCLPPAGREESFKGCVVAIEVVKICVASCYLAAATHAYTRVEIQMERVLSWSFISTDVMAL